MIFDKRIDNGKGFDWGKVSTDYAKYRDIYPDTVFEKLLSLGVCTKGQTVLDVGTGTGVLPRNMYKFGAKFTGTDISENQIEHAKTLARQSNMNIDFYSCSAEDCNAEPQTFDVITACQCFFYFKHEKFAPKAFELLKSGGKLVLIYMAWLPYDDKIAGESEKLILKYNPQWSGCGETPHDIFVPDNYSNYFKIDHSEVFTVDIPFTKETWNGRIKACRGIGASLSDEKIKEFEAEHMYMLNLLAPSDNLNIKHYCAIKILKKSE